MRTISLIIFLLISALSYSQEDLVEKVIQIRQLVTEVKTKEALAMMAQIEHQCMQSTNDTLKAVFLELRGQALLDDEQYEECIPVCTEAISLFAKVNLRQYEYLDAWFIIATALHRLKDYKNAERFYRKGILHSVAAKVDKVEQYRSNLYLNLGNLYKEQGDTLLANECYKRINRNSEIELIDIDDWNYVEWENAYWEKINNLVNDKQYEAAANLYIEFIDGIKEKKGNKDRAYILAVYSRAILLSKYLNKIDEAIPLYLEIVNLSSSFKTDEEICGSYCNLISCYSMKGDFEKVNEHIIKGISYLKNVNLEGYPFHMVYRFAGNGAYWKQNYPYAIKYYEQYIEPANKRESGTDYEEIVNQLSVSYIFSEQPEKAKKLLEDLIKTDEDRLKKENVQTLASVYHNLGRAYMLLNQTSAALKFLTESKNLQNSIYGEVAERTLLYIQECSKK